jgi:hypothetical protein
VAETIGGFIPFVAQGIDGKDTYTAFFEGGNYWDKTFALAAWIPGLDFLKSGRTIFKSSVRATSNYKFITEGYKISGKYTKDFLNSADQVIKGLGAKKFQLSNLDNLAGSGSDEFQKILQKANNNIVDHLDDTDISAMIKEMHGTSIISDTGKVYNHPNEVLDGVKGIEGARRMLEQGFKNDKFSGDVLDAAKSLYKHLENEGEKLNNVLEGVEESVNKSN